MGESTVTRSKRRRANGEGSIYRDKAGRWRGAAVDRTGKRRVVSGKTQLVVQQKLAALKEQLKTGPVTPTSSTPTVGEYLARWLQARRAEVRPSTWRMQEQLVRVHIVPAIGRLKLGDLTFEDVESMTTAMTDRGLSATTAASARVALRRALRDARRTRPPLVIWNAAEDARPPKRERPELRYLQPAELRTLLTATDGHPLANLVTVAATTGMRQGEILGLSWDDVDLEAGRLTVRRSLARVWAGGYDLAEPKTNRSRRTINLSTRAVAALWAERTAQAERGERMGDAWSNPDKLVFTDEAGSPLHGTAVTHAFARILADAGLPHIPFHGLRHTAATALLAAGIPLKVVSDQLGHTTIAITADLYAGVVPELRREAADAMDRVLGGVA